MREFKTSPDRRIVDLDNPDTYKHLSQDIEVVERQIYVKIGQAITYMDGHYPHLYPKQPGGNGSGYAQRQRVQKLIDNFALNRRDHVNDLRWYQEQIFLMQDDCENMC